jgi:hypothetical protein
VLARVVAEDENKPLSLRRLPVRAAGGHALAHTSLPFDGAADRRGLAQHWFLPRQNGIERVAKVVLARGVLVP